ncbi:MAG: MgtC/SapB family protein [Candidatus Gastranaerophilales bacterium]|nr:MgtC/SapB family protein [bacterium]MBR2068811.1 MgtC/SapB family protein [Candidatus Gastranaerophilales bacterium]
MFNIENIWIDLVIIFRILLAIVLAFIPGMERELTGKFAGLRTHILVCVGACVFTILSLYGFQFSIHAQGVMVQDDPARIAAQVITGIGFIGAGTVMRHGTSVSGITTAATLWVCAAIGMSCGCGQYVTAIVASCATLIVLISIRALEKNILAKKKISYTVYEITLSASMNECGDIENIFENNFHKIFKYNKKLINHEELRFGVLVSTKKSLNDLNEMFKAIKCINSIEIREHYE